MPSKQVTDREKSARAIVAATEAHAAEIVAGVTRELSPYLKAGEKLPDIGLLVRLFGRKTEADNAALVAADRAHEKELSDDAAPREARDTAAGEVRAVLVDLRAAIDAGYGPTALAQLGLDQAIPVDPSVLAAMAGDVAKALEDASIKLPNPRRKRMKIDRAGFAEDLRAELPDLQKALAKVSKEEREKDTTQRAKNEAMAKNDATFSACAGWLEATCAVAGLPELAATMRPSGRRPGQRKAEEGGDTAEEAEDKAERSPPPTQDR